jgi:uncharacterized membrane protein YqiK
MTDVETRAIDSSLESTQSRTLAVNDLVQSTAGLTPRQTYRVAKEVARQNMKTAIAHKRIENEAFLAEARVVADARVRSTREQAERLLHDERLDCLAQSAQKHEEVGGLIDRVLDEDARSVFKDALKGASWRYATGVIQRSGG